jgi:hypothetical protein
MDQQSARRQSARDIKFDRIFLPSAFVTDFIRWLMTGHGNLKHIEYCRDRIQVSGTLFHTLLIRLHTLSSTRSFLLNTAQDCGLRARDRVTDAHQVKLLLWRVGCDRSPYIRWPAISTRTIGWLIGHPRLNTVSTNPVLTRASCRLSWIGEPCRALRHLVPIHTSSLVTT